MRLQPPSRYFYHFFTIFHLVNILLQTYGEGIAKPASLGAADLSDVAIAVTATESNIAAANISFERGFKSDSTGVEHAYLKQQYNGIPIINTAANVAFKGESITSFGSSFIDTESGELVLVSILSSTAIS